MAASLLYLHKKTPVILSDRRESKNLRIIISAVQISGSRILRLRTACSAQDDGFGGI